MARMKSFCAGLSDFGVAFVRLIRVIRGSLFFVSIRVDSWLLRLDLVGPEKLPHSYGVDCD